MSKCSFAIPVIFILNAFILKKADGQAINNLNQLEPVNRKVEIHKVKNGNVVVKLDVGEHNGVAWIKNSRFKNGTIEADIQGKDVAQQSFVGIAFHKRDNSRYEAVYLRPFNFSNPLSQSHQIQYICLPNFDWKILRERDPDVYENKLNKKISPNDWFHVKIVVSGKLIAVFIGNDPKASLSVSALQEPISGEVGFWVGNASDGKFRNLIIHKTP